MSSSSSSSSAATGPAANESRYSFVPANLPADTFQVVRFEGTEGLSELFSFTIELVSKQADISFSDVVDSPATLEMERVGRTAPISGIVTDLSLRGKTADYVSYEATLEPRLRRLALGRRSRIFQRKNAEDILRQVFEEGGLPRRAVRFALQGSYPRREFCVQYEESDLNFAKRLMEREGIYFFFEQEGGSETLVVTDAKGEHEAIGVPSALQYHEGAGGMVDGEPETVRRFACEEQVVTGTVSMTAYDARTPGTKTAESQLNGQMPGERYEYGPTFREAGRGRRLAKVQNEAIEAQRRVMTGISNSVGLRSGYKFSLEKHFRDGFNADYLITRVKHKGSQRAGLPLDVQPSVSEENGVAEADAETGEEAGYRNEFACIPASVQYRAPLETPKPEAPGVVTATVESAGGDYAYIDEEGRYRAKMHFDRRTDRADGRKTLPIRMSQPYSGPDYGMHFPNHEGTELLVAFENGDIDRPVALGTTPNPSNASPAVAENKMENVVRTYGGNELMMDDTEEKTRIRLRSGDDHELLFDDEKDKIEILSTDGHRVVLHDEKGRIEIQSEEGRRMRLDDENKLISLVSKDGHLVEMSDEDDAVTVADTDEKHVLTLDYANEKMSLTTEGDISFEAEGAIDMTAESFSVETEKAAEMQVGGDLTQDADGSMTLTSGKSGTVEAAKSLDVSASNITIEASKNLEAKGMSKLALTGPRFEAEGTGQANIKGGILKANG